MAATFADDIFKCIFMDEKFYISIPISLKFVPKGPIDNKAALVQIFSRNFVMGIHWIHLTKGQ